MKRVISDFNKDWMGLTMLAAARWEKDKKPFVVSITSRLKTWEQLKFLHGQVLKPLAQALFDAGEIDHNREDIAKYWLKMAIGYGTYYSFKKQVLFDPKSFEKASLDILTKAIDTALREAGERGIYIPPSR